MTSSHILRHGSEPDGLEVFIFPNHVQIGALDGIRLSMEDFCEMVKYVLTNCDLENNDLRIGLVETIKRMKLGDGKNITRDRYTRKFYTE